MTPDEIKELVANEVKKQLKAEKEKIYKKLKYRLEYTGEFANAYLIMEAFGNWATE
jgi:hypothetical protein